LPDPLLPPWSSVVPGVEVEGLGVEVWLSSVVLDVDVWLLPPWSSLVLDVDVWLLPPWSSVVPSLDVWLSSVVLWSSVVSGVESVVGSFARLVGEVILAMARVVLVAALPTRVAGMMTCGSGLVEIDVAAAKAAPPSNTIPIVVAKMIPGRRFVMMFSIVGTMQQLSPKRRGETIGLWA
jgi:hypothetical protein